MRPVLGLQFKELYSLIARMLKVTFEEMDESKSHKLVIKVTDALSKCHSLVRSVLFEIVVYLTMSNNKPGGLCTSGTQCCEKFGLIVWLVVM